MLLFSKVVQAFSLSAISDFGIFSFLHLPYVFCHRGKRKHQMGNSPQLPTAKLTNWYAATYILSFFLQSQCSKHPSSYSRLVPLVVLCVLPLLALEGLCSIYFPFLLCLQHLPLYCFLLSAFKHIQVSSYYSFFPLWLEGTFYKFWVLSYLVLSLVRTCMVVYNNFSSVLDRLKCYKLAHLENYFDS